MVFSWLPPHDMVRTEVASGLLVAAAMPRYRFIPVPCFYVLLATI